MKKGFFNFLVILTSFALTQCTSQNSASNPDDSIIKITGNTQGTTYSILYVDSLNRDIKGQIDSLLARIDSSLSTYKPNSIISKFNKKKDCILIDDHFLDLFFLSDEIYDATGGAFDPTIKPIVNIWGFGSNPLSVDSLLASLPDSVNKDSLIFLHRDSLAFGMLDYIGWDLLMVDGDLFYNSIDELGNSEFNDNFICKDDSIIQLSFDAIAQGYSVDVIAEFLQYDLGIHDFLIEVGGEIVAQGYKPSGSRWKISIEHPDLNNPDLDPFLAVVEMDLFRAVAVSGNYRNYLKSFNGEVYGHTIDPRTGSPTKNTMLSVAVFAEDCAVADAYATAFMVMGVEESIPFVEINPYEDIEALFIYLNPEGKIETYTSSGLETEIQIVKQDTIQ